MSDVPLTDVDAWMAFPDQRWLYDRLRLALSVSQPAAPCGVPAYLRPVMCRPITDLAGNTAPVVVDDGDIPDTAGWFFQPVLTGPHLFTDLVVAFGRTVWRADSVPEYRDGRLVSLHLLPHQQHIPVTGPADYRGCLNVHTVAGVPIDVRLRPDPRLVDLYPARFLEALESFHAGHPWPGLAASEEEQQSGITPQLRSVKEGWWRESDG